MERSEGSKKPEEEMTSSDSHEKAKIDDEMKCPNENVETIKTGSNKEMDTENEIEEVLSEGVRKERIKEATEIKERGNSEFKKGEYEKAVDHYTEAMKICPKSESRLLAPLFGNRAACYAMMKETLSVIKDCTSALELDPYYIKVRLRRAQAYEDEGKLEEAFEDYKNVLEQDRTCQKAIEAVQRLPDQINEKNDKLKEEMMGKLKDLGNMFLRPFGLSTENFKMQQDPSTGGYSINFKK